MRLRGRERLARAGGASRWFDLGRRGPVVSVFFVMSMSMDSLSSPLSRPCIRILIDPATHSVAFIYLS